MEQYFVELSRRLEGYEEFEKESYSFKVSGKVAIVMWMPNSVYRAA